MASSADEENTAGTRVIPPTDERAVGAETNEPNGGVRPDNDSINDSIVDNSPLALRWSTSDNENNSDPILLTTSAPTVRSANQNEEEESRRLTTDTRTNSDRQIGEWNSDEVLGWFQSHQLDELYNALFTPDETKDGANLAKIFEYKSKNYEQYRVSYTNRLASNQTNLSKDFDRFGQLLDLYFTDKYTHRYDVAFSFPGDIRNRVSEIAAKLCMKINRQDAKKRIFYDKYHQAELARPNLDLFLYNIYRNQTRLIVVFMCDDYSRKEWCGLESRAIRSLLKTYQSDRIMLLTVDGTTIEGVIDIDGYMNISQMNNDDVTAAIYSRLEALGEPLPLSRSLHTPTGQRTPESVSSKSIAVLRKILYAISPWYIIIVLVSYILGTFIGR